MTHSTMPISRRSLLIGLTATGAAAAVGAGHAVAAPAKRSLTAAERRLTMHRSAGCGCCVKWAEAAQKAGFTVTTVNEPDLMAFKREAGVPDSLTSCHTTIAGPYVVEGHVPLDAIRKLLTDRPKVRGIGVAGMPIGSPGMEVPGVPPEPFKIYAFDSAGKLSFFS
ncbi:MAG TPA: DUF411 domain-containing protein [Sphingomicrobium sp.]|nr:DUF411 domain-containing protein [Sphingomicrobium sp.]